MNYREFCEKANELGWEKTKVRITDGGLIMDTGGTVAFKNRKTESDLWDFISYDQVQRIGYDKIVAFMEKYKNEDGKE